MSNQKSKIFIVDDDPRYLELLQFALESENFEVQTCTSPERAVSAAVTFAPDIILSDVSMPDRDGFRLALDFRAEHATADVPLVFITARGQQSDIFAGRTVGAVEYLTKPFSPTELVTKIRNVLATRSSLAMKH